MHLVGLFWISQLIDTGHDPIRKVRLKLREIELVVKTMGYIIENLNLRMGERNKKNNKFSLSRFIDKSNKSKNQKEISKILNRTWQKNEKKSFSC